MYLTPLLSSGYGRGAKQIHEWRKESRNTALIGSENMIPLRKVSRINAAHHRLALSDTQPTFQERVFRLQSRWLLQSIYAHSRVAGGKKLKTWSWVSLALFESTLIGTCMFATARNSKNPRTSSDETLPCWAATKVSINWIENLIRVEQISIVYRSL